MRRHGHVLPGLLIAALSSLQCAKSRHEGAASPASGGKPASGGGAGVGSAGGATAGTQANGGAGAGASGAAGGGAPGGRSGGAGRAGDTTIGGSADASDAGGANGGAGESAAGAGGGGGSLGTSGSATAGGGLGGAPCTDGLVLPVMPRDANSGWIERASNCAGVQGAVTLEADSHGSTITATSLDGHLCVAGSTAQVEDQDFEGSPIPLPQTQSQPTAPSDLPCAMRLTRFASPI